MPNEDNVIDFTHHGNINRATIKNNGVSVWNDRVEKPQKSMLPNPALPRFPVSLRG
jgi:hypothetical protein